MKHWVNYDDPPENVEELFPVVERAKLQSTFGLYIDLQVYEQTWKVSKNTKAKPTKPILK